MIDLEKMVIAAKNGDLKAYEKIIERFPSEFCFLLKYSEVPELRSQIVTSNKANISSKSQMMPIILFPICSGKRRSPSFS